MIKQIEINIDCILILVQKFHDSHMQDKEILVTLQKATRASPQLRSKKQFIELFLGRINNVTDVVSEWNGFEERQRKETLKE